MCLAIPMRVIAVEGEPENILGNQIATVDADGISREVRLDVVDHWPRVGDYLIVHAGFALHTLEEKEAFNNLQLLRDMAANEEEQ